MSTYKERVNNECDELSEKRASLVDFMHGDVYASLPATDQGLLMVQLVAMDNYLDALTRRIQIFNEGDNNE